MLRVPPLRQTRPPSWVREPGLCSGSNVTRVRTLLTSCLYSWPGLCDQVLADKMSRKCPCGFWGINVRHAHALAPSSPSILLCGPRRQWWVRAKLLPLGSKFPLQFCCDAGLGLCRWQTSFISCSHSSGSGGRRVCRPLLPACCGSNPPVPILTSLGDPSTSLRVPSNSQAVPSPWRSGSQLCGLLLSNSRFWSPQPLPLSPSPRSLLPAHLVFLILINSVPFLLFWFSTACSPNSLY